MNKNYLQKIQKNGKRHGSQRLWVLLSAHILLLIIFCSGGCATYKPDEVRRQHTTAFFNSLAQAEAELLQRPLSLDDCVALAMTNNYHARQADLERELYRIGKNVAFTAFLPNVAAKAGYTSYAKEPNIMSERRFSSASLEIGMPLFMPSTWFLYAAARQGYATATTAAYYVRQGIALETTMNYCDVLVKQEAVNALETQLQAAQENAERIGGLAREGFFQAWEADQATLAAESRATMLSHARRQLQVATGKMAIGLGLSPQAPLLLSGELGEISVITNSTAELVLEALQTSPVLTMADRQVVISEHRVRQAFCNFLPALSIFATRSWTGNDIAGPAANWISGLQGVWTLFDGLANVARYRAAKVERRQIVFEREEAFLNVMIQVIAAEATRRDAVEAAVIRQRTFDVARAKANDFDARAREGLIPISEALDARAAMDQAQVELVRSRHEERLATATLELAMGNTKLPDLPQNRR